MTRVVFVIGASGSGKTAVAPDQAPDHPVIDTSELGIAEAADRVEGLL